MSTTIQTWLPAAREAAAQCWCDETTKHLDMTPELAEAVAYRIAAWMETGAFHARNETYWKQRALQAEKHGPSSNASAGVEDLLLRLSLVGEVSIRQRTAAGLWWVSVKPYNQAPLWWYSTKEGLEEALQECLKTADKYK